MSNVLAKGRRLPINRDDSKYLNSYFSRPERVNLIQIGSAKIVFIVEGSGMYTINGKRSMLDKIATSLQKYAKANGYDASINYVNYSDDPNHTDRITYLLGI